MILDSIFQLTTIGKSTKWKNRKGILDAHICLICYDNHGKIFLISNNTSDELPEHDGCRCYIIEVGTVIRGKATLNGNNGADFTLLNYHKLPEYYISFDEIRALGWKKGCSPSDFAPDKIIAKGIYNNRNNHLPSSPKRVWYEADINYISGHRNSSRIVYSNDGLIFVTYDHYLTFYEIV